MKVLKINKIRPMFTGLVTTMDKYEDYQKTSSGLIDGSKVLGALKEYQTVLAVGNQVRDIKVGDLVCVNPTRFSVKQHTAGSLKDGVIGDNVTTGFKFDVLNINDEDCLLLQDRDIDFIVEESEEIEVEVPKASNIIKPPSSIIL